MRKVSILLVLAMLSAMLCVSPLSVFAEDAGVWDGSIAEGFAGGSGTETDPYLISDGSQLAYLAKQVNSGEHYDQKYIKLTDDIDLGDREWTPIGEGFVSGSQIDNPFAGYFDGNGKVISNVKITHLNGHSLGLFGYVYRSVENLGVENMTVEITNAFDSTRITHIGGIVGFLQGYVRRSYVKNLSVTNKKLDCSEGYVGGIAGVMNQYAGIEDSYVDGMTWSGSYNSMMGGLSGCIRQIRKMHLVNCYTSNVKIKRADASYNDKYAEKYFNVVPAELSSSLTVSNCYYTDMPFNSTVYNIGEYKTPGDFAAGGADMLGSNFTSNTNGGINPLLKWETLDNNTWDGSIAEGFAGGSGTADDPYLISDGSQLAYLAKQVNSGEYYDQKYIKLTDDIDLGDREWTPIGEGFVSGSQIDNPFAGYFDGNGKVISNVKITHLNGHSLGLFGYVYRSVENLGVENMTVEITNAFDSTRISHIGGIVGFLQGYVRRSYVKNLSVTNKKLDCSEGYVGGIAGIMNQYAGIEDSYVDGMSWNGSYNSMMGGIAGGTRQVKKVYLINCYVNNIVFAAVSNIEKYNEKYFNVIPAALSSTLTADNCYYTDAPFNSTQYNVGTHISAEDISANNAEILGGKFKSRTLSAGTPLLMWETESQTESLDTDAINKAYADKYIADITLPYITKKADGTVKSDLIFDPTELGGITYTFDNTDVCAQIAKNENGLYVSKLTRPTGEGVTDVKITASVTVGTQTSSKEFTVSVENRADGYEINRVFFLNENNNISDALTTGHTKAVIECDSAPSAQGACVYFAVYGADGRFADIYISDYADDITFNIGNPESGQTFKAFIWAKAGVKPLSETY